MTTTPPPTALGRELQSLTAQGILTFDQADRLWRAAEQDRSTSAPPAAEAAQRRGPGHGRARRARLRRWRAAARCGDLRRLHPVGRPGPARPDRAGHRLPAGAAGRRADPGAAADPPRSGRGPARARLRRRGLRLLHDSRGAGAVDLLRRRRGRGGPRRDRGAFGSVLRPRLGGRDDLRPGPRRRGAATDRTRRDGVRVGGRLPARRRRGGGVRFAAGPARGLDAGRDQRRGGRPHPDGLRPSLPRRGTGDRARRGPVRRGGPAAAVRVRGRRLPAGPQHLALGALPGPGQRASGWRSAWSPRAAC